MAHRKPLGTTCSASLPKDAWDRKPELGDTLRSEAGTCYLVVGIEEGRTRFKYLLERVAEPAPDSWVFEFFWLPRERKSPA